MKTKKNKSFYYYIAASILMVLTITISCSDDDELDGDIINPYVISYNPVSGVGGVDLSSDLVLTFDNIIEKGSGNITITADVPEATQVIDINSDQVTITNVGRILTINPQDFLSGRDYNIVIDAGIVKDTAGNLYFGMPDNEAWTFTSGGNAGDTEAPEIAQLLPMDDATDATVTSIKLTFNEDVKAGSGNIVVYDSSDVAVATVDIEGASVTIDGADIMVALIPSLSFGQDYYVKIEAGVIKDIAGNGFSGFTDATSWSFTTTAGSATDLVLHLPFDTDMKDISGNKFDAIIGATAIADVEFIDDATRGQVVRFNAGAFATFPKHDLLRPSNTQDFSINLWIKLAGTDSDPVIIGNKDWGSGGNPGWLLCTDDGHEYAPGNGTDHGWIINVAGNPKQDGNRLDWRAAACDPQAPSISDDVWHMATLVYDQTNGELSTYIDGVEFNSTTEPERTDLTQLAGSLYDEVNDYPLTLWEDGTGAYNAGDDRRAAMTGLMDELKYYNKALTIDEITALLSE
ncbi:MAG: Ig-like domain-containing protein [Flavobacteriaceae bacterium]